MTQISDTRLPHDAIPPTAAGEHPKIVGVLGLVMMAGLSSGPSFAAESYEKTYAADEPIEELLVTGRDQKRTISTLPGKVEDIPQVITTIDQQTLTNQGVTTLEGALRNVPGVTTDLGEGGVLNGDQFFIRGLSAKNDIFTDGLRDFGVFVRDSFNYEQVEVLKGSSSTTLGRGVTGGGINTSSKTPHDNSDLNVSVAAGTANYLRATADWNQKITDKLAFRLNVMVHENKVARRDSVKSSRWGIAPSLKADLGEDTSLTLTYFHQEDDRLPDYGVGFFNNRPITEYGVPLSNFYGYDTDTDESNVDTFTARLDHQFSDNVSFTSNSKVGAYDRLFIQTINSCSTGGNCVGIDNPATAADATILTRSSPYQQKTWGVQNVSSLLVTAPLGGHKNEFLVGTDLSYQSNERKRFGFDDANRGRIAKNILNPSHGSGPALGAAYRKEDTTARDTSFFFHDQFWVSDVVSLVVGGRYNFYKVDQDRTDFVTAYNLNNNPPCDGILGSSCLTRYASDTEFFNPKASLIWEPAENQHYYISYATSSTPPGVTVSNGTALSASTQDLKPEENETFELGAKLGLFDNRMLMQASLFKTRKDNAKETDPQTGDVIASGYKQNVTGFEIGVSGNATDHLTVSANYTYLDSVIDEAIRSGAVLPDIEGNRTPYTPEHAASVYITYDFAGVGIDGLQLGGGGVYQSDVMLNRDNSQSLDGYVTFDGFVAYQIEGYRLAVNVNNLTDKAYFAQIHSSRVTPAAGRTIIATLSASF